MGRYVALLRGVNVGGNRKIAMQDLRAAVEDLGYGRVATYIQSGNLVFDAETADEEAIAVDLERGVGEHLGLDSEIVVRSAVALDAVVARNPFVEEAEADPAKVAVHFLRAPLAATDLPPMPEEAVERVSLDGRHIYVSYPQGIGRSKLDARYWRQYPKAMVATARNWRTVLALRDLVSA